MPRAGRSISFLSLWNYLSKLVSADSTDNHDANKVCIHFSCTSVRQQTSYKSLIEVIYLLLGSNSSLASDWQLHYQLIKSFSQYLAVW